MEEGNAIFYTGGEPTEAILNRLRAEADHPPYQIRRSDYHICWVRNPLPRRLDEFPILVEENNGR